MPVAFLSRQGGVPGFVPVTQPRFCLGSAAERDLVDDSPGVAPRHAVLTCQKGEYVLAAGDGLSVLVNEVPVPLMRLRDGDALRLTRPGTEWVFRNRLEGAFVPPQASLAQAWMAHPEFGNPAHGPDAFGTGEAIGGREAARCRRVGAVVVKDLGPVRSPADADHHLSLLGALGGGRHPGLVALVDGGLSPGADGAAARRWVATAWVEGMALRERLEGGPVEPGAVLELLRPVADALALLHRRGIVHRDVAPGNVIVDGRGRGTLIDFGQARLLPAATPPSRGVVGTPGYVAPEEVLRGAEALGPAVDVYGLGALAYALLTGSPPAAGEDLLATLAGAAHPPPRPSELGFDLPDALDSALAQALSPDPARRPGAAAFVRALEFSRAQLGLGGVAR